MTLSGPAFSDPFQLVSNYHSTGTVQPIDFLLASHGQANRPMQPNGYQIGLTDWMGQLYNAHSVNVNQIGNSGLFLAKP
jgi:hypothetical protein